MFIHFMKNDGKKAMCLLLGAQELSQMHKSHARIGLECDILQLLSPLQQHRNTSIMI